MNKVFARLNKKIIAFLEQALIEVNGFISRLTPSRAAIFLLTAPLKLALLLLVSGVVFILTFGQLLLNLTIGLVFLSAESLLLANAILLFIERFQPKDLISLYEVLLFGSEASRALLYEFQSYKSLMEAFHLSFLLVALFYAAQRIKRLL